MKVDKLHIRSRFKNLESVVVDFDKDHLMTVIVGRNGLGKSNILEALVVIFRNLDLGESPAFSYELIYQLGAKQEDYWLEINIDADPSRGTLAKQYEITCKNLKSEKQELEAVSIHKVKRDSKTGISGYLPKYVFAYYSGPSDRLESYFKAHRKKFYDKLLNDEVDLKGDIRPLFYAKPLHSQFVLLAFFLDTSVIEQEFLKKHLKIEGIDSVHFVMRRPDWGERNSNEIFWGARGAVRKFLDLLYEEVLAPIKVERNEDLGLIQKNIKNEFLHLFLPEVASLKKFASGLSPNQLFKMFESTLLSEILSEVNIRIKIRLSDDSVTFRELSEGEQQLLIVLGLLKFTADKDSLFLLDEPDTHLNPAWAIQYLNFLRQFVSNSDTSHVIMTTHQPLTIADLKKEQVQIVKEMNNQIIVEIPDENPKGMGVNLILRSEMFGLNTTLDHDTDEKIRERNALASKDQLTDEDEEKLNVLNEQLEQLGFNWSTDDPDYLDFLKNKYLKQEE